MRISDWSSDVCSSDLAHRLRLDHHPAGRLRVEAGGHHDVGHLVGRRHVVAAADEMDVRGEAETGDLRLQRRLDAAPAAVLADHQARSEEHTSELQSLMRTSYAVFCLKKKNINKRNTLLNS